MGKWIWHPAPGMTVNSPTFHKVRPEAVSCLFTHAKCGLTINICNIFRMNILEAFTTTFQNLGTSSSRCFFKFNLIFPIAIRINVVRKIFWVHVYGLCFHCCPFDIFIQKLHMAPSYCQHKELKYLTHKLLFYFSYWSLPNAFNLSGRNTIDKRNICDTPPSGATRHVPQ